MRYAVIAVGGVHTTDQGTQSTPPDNVIKQDFVNGTILCCFSLFTVNFLLHDSMPSDIIHHPDTIYHFVVVIEVSLHEKNGPQL